jgi:hypothetical protein
MAAPLSQSTTASFPELMNAAPHTSRLEYLWPSGLADPQAGLTLWKESPPEAGRLGALLMAKS